MDKEQQMEDEIEIEIEGAEIEVEDDTPPEDRNRAPMPKEIVDELEADELEEYSEKVKVRLKQMKKVWHDERRVKEKEQRERQAAEAFAQRLLDENNRLKNTISYGEKTLVSSYLDTAEMEIASARREYKQAYESGDSDAVVDAQEKLTNANLKLSQLRSYRPTLQDESPAVHEGNGTAAPPARLDQKTTAWQERNTWFGTDPEMTASALGLHQKLEKQNGVEYVGSDDYWQSIESTMQRRFPEYFGETEKPATGKPARSEQKAATVVAPASRSTSSKRIVLTQSQVTLAKKLGLTAQQYAAAALKVEK